ncbi:MAG: ParB N-terminal domain-containing protein [Coriobacteriales bacterium]|nr:ParB N-terminal domain-containing protein [Coriobacteriales bacterium]
MSKFALLPIEKVKLDEENPRIAEILKSRRNVTAELIELALGSGRDVNDPSSTSYSSLKESIRANGGIINPIIVKSKNDDTYVAIEGNTRLQIYKDFSKNRVPGNWSEIPAIVYDEMTDDEVDQIRLQCHLVGPRPWDPYAKARYLYQLNIVEGKPLNQLVSFCGGKASDVTAMIDAYKDMEEYYRPIINEMGIDFNAKKYSAFREAQNKNVADAIARAGYTKADFARWVAEEKIDKMSGPRALPKILADKEAKEKFLSENVTEAKKILDAKEVKGFEEFENMPLNNMLSIVARRLSTLPWREMEKLKSDVDYSDNRQAIYDLKDDLDMMIETIEE